MNTLVPVVMNTLVPVVERHGVNEDMSYVFHSWLKGSRQAWPEMRTEDYFALQHQRIVWLLRSTGNLVVLHPEGSPGVIAAWAVLDHAPTIAHYVHVRGEYRRKGFASRLLTGRTVATHLTEQGGHLKRKLGLRYMPQLLDGMGAP